MKEAQVQDLNKRLVDYSKDLRKAEKALRKLQQEKDKRTKQVPQITAKQIQELIDEGIKKNPISQWFNNPKTPPNTGNTSMKTAPENQQDPWKRKPYYDEKREGKKKIPTNEEETLRMGVRFQETIQLSQKERELLKKGKLPEGRYSERRSERSNAPEPSVTGASHGLAQISSAPERLPCSETHSLVLLESRSLERSGFAFTVENTGARN